MATYNVHGGHSLVCRGAADILDEVIEDRKVKNKVIKLLRSAGHTVYDCTDDAGISQPVNLKNIVTKCNQHKVDLDISIHLNSGRNDDTGDGSTGGVEVFGYTNDTRSIGSAICENIASTLGIRNRGYKLGQGLYVLRNTVSPAILVECCFVDDRDDANVWDADKCAECIVKGIIGTVPTTTPNNSTSTPISNKYAVGQTVSYGTSYKNPTDPCGYEAAVGGSGHGTITAIVNGQAKYKLSSGVYCNDGDIIGLYTAPANTSTSTAKKELNADVAYMVYANNRWYPPVINLTDYAGDGRNPIRAIAIKVTKGSVAYRVHIKNGDWLPIVTGFDKYDNSNGYAGTKRSDIDAVEVYFSTPDGYQYKKAKYRVAPVGKDYYSWQTDKDTTNGMDGYAGNYGTALGKFQMYLE